jgi:hypothetical protein
MEVTQEANTQATAPVVADTTPAPEVKPEVAIPEKKDSLSSQFAALAKKEKKILSDRQALEAKNKELEEKLKEYEQFKTKKSSAKVNPLEYLSEAGLTYDEITQFMLNGGVPQPKDKATELEEKLNAFVEKQEKEKQEQEELKAKQLQEQEEKVIAQFKESVKKHIKDGGERFELINLYDAQELVISTIEAHFEKTQQILDNDTAADLVEKHLEGEIAKLAKANKFKDKFKLEENKTVNTEKKDSVTLNSSMASSSVPSSLPAKTEQDRIKRALAALG